MAYNSDYLALAVPRVGILGKSIWFYDTADATGTVDGTGYFSDGAARGMCVGDLVYVTIWTTAPPTSTSEKNGENPADAALHVVRAVDGDAATVAAETALSVAAGA